MNRLLINHVEAYLLFANKIFTTAVDSYKDEHNRFYNGIKLLIKFVDLFLLNYLIYIKLFNLYFSCFIFINSRRNND